MAVNITEVPSKRTDKIYYTLEWGKGPGQRRATGIFTYKKAKDSIQKNHNKEALAILETKRSRMILDLQAIGTGHVLQHKMKLNFLDFYAEFVSVNERSGNRSLSCSLSAFKKFIGKDSISAAEITENLCERFRNYLLDNLSGETPADYFMRFKRMIKAAKKQGYFVENPAEDVKAKAHPSGIKDVLSVEEYMTLINSYCSNYEVKKAAICSMYTGLRWCDIEPLQWWQIKENTIVLKKQSKTGVPLEIPLHAVVKTIIGERHEPDDLVFYLPTQDGANKVLGAWVNEGAKIDKHITWHCLRHSVSDILQDNGVDATTVAAVLGHTSAKYVLSTYKKRVEMRHKVEAIKCLPSIGKQMQAMDDYHEDC